MSYCNLGRYGIAVSATALLALLGATGAEASAVIDNGTVALGVNDQGNLIFNDVGLTFLPSPAGGQDALTPGCACEAWGVGDFATRSDAEPFFGQAGEVETDRNLFDASLVVSGTGTDPRATGASAISTVSVGDPALAAGRRLSVVHDFSPSLDPRLYEVKVSITNTGTVDIGDLRYRRAMDWDIPPTEFSEFVTIQGLPASAVVATSDNGFAAGNPLQPTGAITAPENSNVTDDGPADHGATFDFSFGGLAVGTSRDFIIYYGAAANEAEALEALRAVGAEVYSLGQASGEGGPRNDLNTFIFAFAGVGGVPIGGTRADFLPLYVDVPVLVTSSHFRNVGLRLSGRLGGGETPAVSTVASLMDGAPAQMGAAAGDTSPDDVFGVSGLRAFITGSFGGSQFRPDTNTLGADVTGYAITAGLDYELARNDGLIDSAIVGLGLGWSSFTADIHDGGSDAEGDSITLLAYGAATVAKDIRIDLTVGHSWVGLEGARLSGGPGVFANGKTDATDFAVLGRVAYDFAVPTEAPGTGMTVSPYFALEYHAAEVDGFVERGANAMAVNGYSSDSLTSELGLGAEFAVPLIAVTEQAVIRLSAGWVHEYMDGDFTITQHFGTTTVTSTRGNNDHDYLRLGGGVAVPLAAGVAFSLDYEGIHGNSDYTHNTLSVRTRIAF